MMDSIQNPPSAEAIAMLTGMLPGFIKAFESDKALTLSADVMNMFGKSSPVTRLATFSIVVAALARDMVIALPVKPSDNDACLALSLLIAMGAQSIVPEMPAGTA